jgi:hypothetical protein
MFSMQEPLISVQPIDYTVTTALAYARSHRIEDWIHAYLSTGAWANPGLSRGLRLQRRWWTGPIKVPLADLERACGPEPHMEYRVDAEPWEQRITEIMPGLTHPLALPPLIAEYRAGTLSLRDGNHRHEAMRRKGWTACWAIIWYNTQADFVSDRHRTSAGGVS